MAKWSFLLVLLSLGVALAVTPETRRIFREPRTLLVLAGAALPILPFGLWLATIDPDPCRPPHDAPWARAIARSGASGRRRLSHGHPARVSPVDRLRAVPRLAVPEVASPLAMLSQAVAIRLASLTAIVTLALMAALLLLGFATRGALFGISRFAIHYLFPFSLFAALALAGLAAQRVEEQRFAQRLAIVSLAVALVIFLVKLASFYVVPGGSEATNLLPYARLADELTKRGLGSAQFVTLSPRDAGNLAIYLPEARGTVVEREDRASAA
jgi:hypothetical protein